MCLLDEHQQNNLSQVTLSKLTSANNDFLPRRNGENCPILRILCTTSNQLVLAFFAVEQDTSNMCAGYNIEITSGLVRLVVCL